MINCPRKLSRKILIWTLRTKIFELLPQYRISLMPSSKGFQEIRLSSSLWTLLNLSCHRSSRSSVTNQKVWYKAQISRWNNQKNIHTSISTILLKLVLKEALMCHTSWIWARNIAKEEFLDQCYRQEWLHIWQVTIWICIMLFPSCKNILKGCQWIQVKRW